jgi:hypothetical protein
MQQLLTAHAWGYIYLACNMQIVSIIKCVICQLHIKQLRQYKRDSLVKTLTLVITEWYVKPTLAVIFTTPSYTYAEFAAIMDI